MYFSDRKEAGEKLAKLIWEKYNSKNTVVFGLPRGGMVTAYEVAKKLHAPLSYILTKKIGHPMDPEYAIAAISEHGFFIEDVHERDVVGQTWLAREIAKKEKEIQNKKQLYGPVQQASGKIAIIVDDGIATGLTIRAAVADIQKEKPKKIIVAAPVIQKDAYKILEKSTDDVVTLFVPKDFLGSVSAYYKIFPQVPDEEAIRLLQKKV